MRRLTWTILAAALLSAAGAGPANAGPPNATAISVATDHACALLSNGTVKCWGANDHGQLGDGSRRRSLSAVAVHGLTDAKAIAAGWDATCAVLSGGTVECWGDNRNGELGDGTKITRPLPVPVSGVTDAVAVTVSEPNGCALLADHTVKCWGHNYNGELGNGTRTDSLTAVAVSGLTDVTAISGDSGHECALLTGGSVACWGWDGGLGSTPEARAGDQLTPVVATGVSGATRIDASPYRDCAVLDSGVAECWDSSRRLALVPHLPRVLAYDWSTVGQQTEHACELLAGGTVKCQSPTPQYGLFGDGTRTRSARPVAVPGLRDATMIGVADFAACALRATGGVACWGSFDTPPSLATTKRGMRPIAVRGLR